MFSKTVNIELTDAERALEVLTICYEIKSKSTDKNDSQSQLFLSELCQTIKNISIALNHLHDYTKYHETICSHCNADLTVPTSVKISIATNEDQTFEVYGHVNGDGLLIDKSGLVEAGFQTFCFYSISSNNS